MAKILPNLTLTDTHTKRTHYYTYTVSAAQETLHRQDLLLRTLAPVLVLRAHARKMLANFLLQLTEDRVHLALDRAPALFLQIYESMGNRRLFWLPTYLFFLIHA